MSVIPSQIQRKQNSATYSLTGSSATTAEIPYNEFAAGGYILTVVTSAATATYYGADAAGGTYRPIYDNAGTPAVKTQAIAVDRAFAMPAETLSFGAIKLVLDTGTATAIFARKA